LILWNFLSEKWSLKNRLRGCTTSTQHLSFYVELKLAITCAHA
jgi:hypothetical protein